MNHEFNSMSMSEAANYNTLSIRTTKNKGAVIGGKRVVKPVESSKESGFKCKTGYVIPKLSNGRKADVGLYRKVKQLVVQEYKVVFPCCVRWSKYDLDHINGRYAQFPLSAMFDPRNLQLLTREQHVHKTNALSRQEQRMDYRTESVKNRLREVAERIEKRLGGAWTNAELKKAVELEIYSK